MNTKQFQESLLLDVDPNIHIELSEFGTYFLSRIPDIKKCLYINMQLWKYNIPKTIINNYTLALMIYDENKQRDIVRKQASTKFVYMDSEGLQFFYFMEKTVLDSYVDIIKQFIENTNIQNPNINLFQGVEKVNLIEYRK